MYISQETPEQTHDRLLRVIARAQLVQYSKPFTFVEVPASQFPLQLLDQALAFVRDDQVWSALVPSEHASDERFVLFSFYFEPNLDNSGFVGWLATHLKNTTGSGVMVVCGQNSQRGGIFDYWGAPIGVADQVLAQVHYLRALFASSSQPANELIVRK